MILTLISILILLVLAITITLLVVLGHHVNAIVILIGSDKESFFLGGLRLLPKLRLVGPRSLLIPLGLYVLLLVQHGSLSILLLLL